MTTRQPSRLAIIGCGAVVQTHLLPALRRIGWKPEVLVDPSPQNLEAASRLVGRSSGLTQAREWSEAADAFDAAIVAAPHVLHGPIGEALARAGKHVFMEKPLATSVAEGQRTLDAAKAKGVAVSVGLLRRYLHIARWTHALLQAGVLGEVRRVEAREGFVFNWATSTSGLLRREVSGGGVLMDTGAHTVDELLWWLGAAEVTGFRDDADPNCVEADCAIDLALPSGGIGRIELSRSRDLPNTCRIEGSKGFVEVSLYRNEVLTCSDNVRAFRLGEIGPNSMPEQRFPELFSAELTDFRTTVETGTQAGVAGEEGMRSVALIEKCYAMRTPLAMPWITGPAEHEAAPKVAPGTRVVVTGATGFIGGRLVERLLEQGAVITCPVRGYGSAVRLARLPVDIRRMDLTDTAAVEALVQDAELVFHCAYDPRIPAQHIVATRNLIAASTKHKVKRFLLTSTFSVYEPFPDGPVSEQTRDGDKSWVYTRTKLELERLVFDAVRDHGLAGTIVQPSIVYGPFSRPWTIAPAEMLLYGTVVLPDGGEGLCNALYVDDLVDAMILATQKPEAIGERFVISGPQPVTWGRFYEAFAAALRVKGPVYRPAADISRENSGLMHDVRMVAKNPKKIIQIAVRVPAVRTLLQNGLNSLPKPAYELVSRIYFGDGRRPTGVTYLPDPQQLRLYAAKARVELDKAQRLLGYQPRYDFPRGMAATSRYLEWAYGGAAPPAQEPAPETPAAAMAAE